MNIQKHHLFHDDIPSNLTLKGSIAIDTEAMGLNIKRDRLCLVQMCDEDGTVVLVKYNNGSPYSSPNLTKLLTDKNRTKLFHYARFDVAILRHYLKIDEIPSLYCTKIASKLVRTYTDSHGLKTLVREMTGVVLDKEQQTSNWGNDTLTNEQIKYACSDVLYLHKIRDGLEKMFSLIEPERKTIANRCFETINLICSLDLNNFSESIFSHN